ncbi:hypothetical protein PYCCODRAFT_1386418 [Trametes coccinea BRFM310]|uniref:MYND-type domain-containing protein n=1 Tax=Trametes coccinea (strain BRFM310) TaxID=1353009 RepID=A0A1Y2IV14_TRAC3|nr:hypothetical protein PYCCODRAFT_1386418 [Trametes coccinea BRFM310]
MHRRRKHQSYVQRKQPAPTKVALKESELPTRSGPILVQEVSVNRPVELFKPGLMKGFENYLTLQEEVCYHYRSPPDFRKLYKEGQRTVKANDIKRLERGVELKDGPLMFEYCLRILSSCDVPSYYTVTEVPVGDILGDVAGLATYSTLVRTRGEFAKVKNSSSQLQLRALSAYAYLHFWAFWRTNNPGSLYTLKTRHVMHNAAKAANICVERGFIPPIALHIASWMATTKARFGVDARQLEKFRGFRPLWKAHEDYVASLRAQEALRLEKVAKAPNQYKCANDECEIQAFDKHAFRRCGGDCPPNKKPHYCSLYCQQIHWVYHREFCKKLSDNSEILDDDGDSDWVDQEDFRPKAHPDAYWNPRWSIWAEREGPEIFIDISHVSPYRRGEIIRLRTKTLSPVCLNVYKRYWTLPEAARDVIDTSLQRW